MSFDFDFYEFADTGKGIFAISVGSLIGFLLVIFFITAIGNKITFPVDQARIEQLREDAAQIDQNSEDVVGQIAQVNQEIKKKQALNDIFFLSLQVPNEWDDVELIKLPDSTK